MPVGCGCYVAGYSIMIDLTEEVSRVIVKLILESENNSQQIN